MADKKAGTENAAAGERFHRRRLTTVAAVLVVPNRARLGHYLVMHANCGIAATEHDVIRGECVQQLGEHTQDRLAPAWLAGLVQRLFREHLLQTAIPRIRNAAEFQRHHEAVDDDGRADAGAEPEKKH